MYYTLTTGMYKYKITTYVRRRNKMPIPPCTPSSSIDMVAIGLYTFVNTYACDVWVVPHILAPMFLCILTRAPFFAFAIAGIAEIGEALANAMFGDFVIFITDNDVGENITGILLDDWLIQGGIGVLLGIVIIAIFKPPRYIDLRDICPARKGEKRHVGRFFYYLFLFLFLVAPAITYRLAIGSFSSAGVILYPVLNLGVIGIHLLIQYCQRKRVNYEFWFTIVAISLVLNVQNIFDYLYSSAIQSWLWSSVIMLYLLLRLTINISN
jgi:hypothetical protein